MKKITKQRIMVLFIVFIFSASTIAYVMTGTDKGSEQLKPLDKFVVDGELNQNQEYLQLSMGFTILKLYSQSDFFEADQLPDIFKTNNGQVQLIVEKINANETHVKITGPNNEEEFANVTKEKIYNALCRTLYDPPAVECGLINITI
ncbi:MAG: hypothetical protein V1900_00195 [Candidatus Aenigmatarchaeota archaeon]